MKLSVLAASLSAALFLAACVAENAAPVTSAPSSGSAGAPFVRTATYPVYLNVPQGVDPQKETVAEISTVSADGKTLIYTDAAGKRIGFVDISDLSRPRGAGSVSLATLGNADDQPTSVAVHGDYVLVVIDETGGNFRQPKGRMDVLRLRDRAKVASIDLLGQPDSIAVSPDGRFAAIAIENQRDEERKDVDGGLPQMPPGFVQVIELSGNPQNWRAEPVRFNGKNGAPLPIVAAAGLDTPQDVEPEYVSINAKNQAAVTLQENNGIAVIDLPSRRLLRVFSAGSVSAENIDTKKDGLIQPSGSLKNVPREPDAVAWIGNDYLATANEGDWKGGSRGWSIFSADGKLVWDAGNSFEEIATRHGLHNEDRAGKKGPEPEGLAVAEIGGTRYAFVASERSNFIAVYNVNRPAAPQFVQLLFTTNGPEGILPIPARGALAVSSETDKAKKGVRSALNLYRTGSGESQPSLVSATQNGNAVGWTALSALTADPRDAQILYAASDSALKHGFIYRIDLRQTPAVIENARAVTRNGKPAENLDIEGIFKRPQGGFWLASEGKTGAENRIIRTDDNLEIVEEIRLPEEVARHIGKWGLEGITAVNEGGRELLYVAIQRPLWRNPAAKNLETVESDYARIGQYDTAARSWRWFLYPLEKTAAKGDWIGLSEITAVNGRTLAVIERDKLNGEAAQIKRIYTVSLPENAAAGQVVPLQKKLALDILPKLRAPNGYTQEKLEGFTIAADGRAYAVTDNDGLDNATGETVFLRLGAWRY